MNKQLENVSDNPQHSAFLKAESLINRLKKNTTPPQLIMIVFFILIWMGTALLTLPHSSSTGKSVGLLNALFTATSAICVNGLIVVDTGSVYSLFGQIVIMVLIQIGGRCVFSIVSLPWVFVYLTKESQPVFGIPVGFCLAS
ncbi:MULTISPECIES: potassium transporter TrkG [Paenibacillus]|uniref:potassium transporter TrkG n=1 Tax=Paenibacillus TaxID=44249 RepID=UPI002FE40BFF